MKSREARPKTVEEAVDEVISWLSNEDKEAIRSCDRDGLIAFHHGLGTAIRNELGLWGVNKDLINAGARIAYPELHQDSEASATPPPIHPDDISSVIIEAVWEKLQSDPQATSPGMAE